MDKAIIFDLDGTLLNSLDDLADTTNDALKAYNLPTHSIDSYKYFVGEGIEMLLRRAAPEGTNEHTIKQLISHASKEYTKHWARKTKPYEGIEPMLQKLADMKVKMAVLTNKRQEFAQQIVSHFFPKAPFTVVFGSPVGGKAKPDPALALKIAAMFNISTQNILFVGDTKTDMKTAVAAQMIPIGVLWGFRTQKELLENGASILINKPNDIFEYL